jgi:hypothetical protein
MSCHRIPRAALPAIVAMTFLVSGAFVAGQVDPDPATIAHIGAWRINFQKSAPGAEMRWSPTATNIFAAEKGGVRHSIYGVYPPKVDDYETVYTDEARTYWFKLDGKNIYPNPQGPNGQGQTAGMWLIDRNTILRERATKGVVDERVLYRVSPDGRTLTWTGFNADRDSSQTAWDRITLPAR